MAIPVVAKQFHDVRVFAIRRQCRTVAPTPIVEGLERDATLLADLLRVILEAARVLDRDEHCERLMIALDEDALTG